MNTTRRLNTCLASWSATWEDLGADDRAAFRDQCVEEWDTSRASMEAREVRLAEDACAEALSELTDMKGCDELRLLYLP